MLIHKINAMVKKLILGDEDDDDRKETARQVSNRQLLTLLLLLHHSLDRKNGGSTYKLHTRSFYSWTRVNVNVIEMACGRAASAAALK